MTRRPLPEFDGEHSSAWWRTIAIAHLQQHRTARALLARRVAEQIRHRRYLATQDATCEGDTEPPDQPTGGTKP